MIAMRISPMRSPTATAIPPAAQHWPIRLVRPAAKVMTFDADDVAWANSTITARYAVIYDATPAADADKKLLAYVDFGADKSSSSGTFQITWNASGIFTVTAA